MILYDIAFAFALTLHVLLLLLLLPLCSVFTVTYLKQTVFLGYVVLQLFCV
jgi:hypothetical protein